MIERTPEEAVIGEDESGRSTTLRRPSTGSVGPASRFQDELDAVLRSASDEDSLRKLIVDCLFRHRTLVGGGWFQKDGDSFTTKNSHFENPALQHKPIQDWIAANCVAACDSENDVVSNSADVRNLAIVAVPIGGFECPEVIVLLLANPSNDKIETETLAGRTVVRAIAEWQKNQSLHIANQQLRTTAALLELTGKIEATQNVTEAARVLADTLHGYVKNDFVAVGLCNKGGRTTKLIALSNVSAPDANSSTSRNIKAVIDECVIRDCPAIYRADEESAEHQLLAHKKLAQTGRSPVILSTPLKTLDGVVVGGLLLAGTGEIDSSVTRELLNTIEIPAGSALDVVRRGQRGVTRRLTTWVFGQNRFAKSIAAIVAVVITGLILLIPMPYRVSCQFSVQPFERRYCVAPFDGMLQESMVRPGDTVAAGEILATMDDADMRYELAGLVADNRRAEKERDVHLAGGKVADSYMAALEADRIRSRQLLLQNRLAALNLESPISGVVLLGGNERRENFPVEIGQTLYEISPLNEVILEVGIQAAEVDHVQMGMAVEVRLETDPSKVRRGTIKRIRPRSEIIESQNVFVAEVQMPNPDGSLRPGMKGTARVISKSHRLGWNLFHHAHEYIVARLF